MGALSAVDLASVANPDNGDEHYAILKVGDDPPVRGFAKERADARRSPVVNGKATPSLPGKTNRARNWRALVLPTRTDFWVSQANSAEGRKDR